MGFQGKKNEKKWKKWKKMEKWIGEEETVSINTDKCPKWWNVEMVEKWSESNLVWITMSIYTDNAQKWKNERKIGDFVTKKKNGAPFQGIIGLTILIQFNFCKCYSLSVILIPCMWYEIRNECVDST